MKNLMLSFVRGEEGFILSTEAVLVGTIAIIGMILGLVAVRNAVVLELQDFSVAVGALNQSYTYTGVTDTAATATTQGSSFSDTAEPSDAASINVTSPAAAAET